MNFMDVSNQPIFQLIVVIVIFLILTFIGVFIANSIRNSSNRYLNPEEFLPEDEIHTLRQVFYLIMMAFFFAMILYSFVFPYDDVIYFVIPDIIISLYVAIQLDERSYKNMILFLLLVPYGSLNYLLFGFTLVGLVDFIHLPVFVYLIKVYYDKFTYYTESNGLNLTIMLLFVIIFISFFITQIVENTNPLDAMVMVSNAFTSNGYSVLGHSIPGKINSIFLVWGGYIISGATTASLTAAILLRHFNKRFEKLQKLIDEEGEE